MAVTGTYNPNLVALSILVAAFAAYTALDLGERMSATRGAARRVDLAAAAIAMGGGIWSMHFIGMLAFTMPIPMSYDIGLTALSLLVTIFVTGAGFYFINRQGAPPFSLVFSSIFMGLGIAAMHYIGMAAMRQHAEIHYDSLFVALSLAIAIGASTAALWLAFRTTDLGQKLAAAIVMGLAISGMHYSAMFGTTFAAHGPVLQAQGNAGLDQTNLALVVAGVTFIILAFTVIASLQQENGERRRAEVALRRSEAYLAQAQTLSHTGSWHWKVGSGGVSWSAEHFRIFGFDPATTQPSYATFMERVHAEDRPSFEQAIQRAVRERSRFQHEYRIVLPNGSVKLLQSVGQPDVSKSGDLEFVGTVMDVTERRYAEEALRSTQAELARVARLTTMGELTASLSHEINQPLAAIMTNAEAGLQWLNRDEPDLDEARVALSHMMRDAQRASGVIRGLRALAKKSGPQVAKLDINDAIQEVLLLTRCELQRHGVVSRTNLSADDRPAFGDRVQLQQVLLNLIVNAVESMSTVTDRPKILTITSEPIEPGGLQVAVEDSGTGFDPAIADRIFDSFFTTKSEGMGMGLSICRSIIGAHGGRISVSPGVPHGTVFRFTVPGMPPG